MNNLKILVMTVPSWNSKVGANSWASLLEGYPPENLANICIREEIPDSEICSRYFCISENRIIKSILKRNIRTAYEVEPNITDNDKDLKEHNQRYIAMKKKRRYSMLLARELIWKFGNWKTKELNEFLDSFKPDIILHSMEGYIHLNRITQYAIKRTGAKAIGYIWDDNFTYKQHRNLGYKFYRFFQRHSLKRLSSVTKSFFAISPLTKKEADEFFCIDSILLTKPLNSIPTVSEDEANKPLKMLYTGNLLIGRDASLEKVSKALNEINKDETKIVLDVYTGTFLDKKVKASICSPFCKIHEPIPQEEVLKLQKQVDILLFLEDIDGEDAKVARLSFSTKITDYLSSGKCILAVGNRDIAPMQYFKDNDCALIATNTIEIVEALNLDKGRIEYYAKNAVNCGIKNHSPEKIKETFYNTINSL